MSALQTRIYSVFIIVIILMGLVFLVYYSQQNDRISSLQNQVSSVNQEVQNLQSSNDALQAQLSSSQNQVISPPSLSQATVEATDVSVSAHCFANITQFQAATAGYLFITGTTSSPNSSIFLVEHFLPPLNGQTTTGGEYQLVQGSNNLIVPVTAGYVIVNLQSETMGSCNSQASDFADGTFSVQYYHY